MKIYASEHRNLNFNAGMTKAIRQEIKHCDVNSISAFLQKQGVENDFKNNKTVAWCSLKCVQLIQYCNKIFNLELDLPKGIFVEDFGELNGIKEDAMGFANFAPAKLYKQKQFVVPEQTIFFNECKNADSDVWSNIDFLSDFDFFHGIRPTDYFLEMFIHEFMHVLHEQNLLQKLGGQKLIEFLKKYRIPENKQAFYQQYKDDLKHICSYATQNPFEAVACDLSKRVVENLDKEKLIPEKDFISSGPYAGHLLPFHFYRKKSDRVLSEIWNGKI